MATVHPLDDPAGSALRGPHLRLAVGGPRGIRYPPDISVLASIGDGSSDAWGDLATVSSDAIALMLTYEAELPNGWEEVRRIPLEQMVDDHVPSFSDDADAEVVALTESDLTDMLKLVAQTAPGPFENRTIELGGYFGIRQDGRLAAMAGRRMHPDGWVEVSAVCTDPEFRGRGYAKRVMRAVIRGIQAENLRAFLHVADGNPAKAVYESMGFVVRRPMIVTLARPLGAERAGK